MLVFTEERLRVSPPKSALQVLAGTLASPSEGHTFPGVGVYRFGKALKAQKPQMPQRAQCPLIWECILSKLEGHLML